MATGRQFLRGMRLRQRPRSGLESLHFALVLLAAISLGGGAVLGLRETGFASWLLDAPPAAVATVTAQSFPVCAGGTRITCVVDGDTFWLDGEKIRIADINTPEIGSPSCSSEAVLGRQATKRLAELLSAGPFALAPADRDEDRYGRKLRIVERDGSSIGQMLVAEGLAHEWQGRRESWC